MTVRSRLSLDTPERSVVFGCFAEMEEKHCYFLSCVGVSGAFCYAQAAVPSIPNPLLADTKKVSAEAPGLGEVVKRNFWFQIEAEFRP